MREEREAAAKAGRAAKSRTHLGKTGRGGGAAAAAQQHAQQARQRVERLQKDLERLGRRLVALGHDPAATTAAATAADPGAGAPTQDGVPALQQEVQRLHDLLKEQQRQQDQQRQRLEQQLATQQGHQQAATQGERAEVRRLQQELGEQRVAAQGERAEVRRLQQQLGEQQARQDELLQRLAAQQRQLDDLQERPAATPPQPGTPKAVRELKAQLEGQGVEHARVHGELRGLLVGLRKDAESGLGEERRRGEALGGRAAKLEASLRAVREQLQQHTTRHDQSEEHRHALLAEVQGAREAMLGLQGSVGEAQQALPQLQAKSLQTGMSGLRKEFKSFKDEQKRVSSAGQAEVARITAALGEQQQKGVELLSRLAAVAGGAPQPSPGGRAPDSRPRRRAGDSAGDC